MGFLGAAHGWGGLFGPPSLKSVTHPTVMKLGTVIPYLRKILKIYKSHDTSLLTHQFFHRKSVHFATSRNTDVDWVLMHDF